MRSTAFEGGGYVLLEFEAGFDSKAALADVRAKVDEAKRDLPRDADEPQVQEVNLSLYPVLVVALSGDLPERTLLRIARTGRERDRAGAGRARRGAARRARRGGRDHRRADADEELRRLARPADRRHAGVEQPGRRRRARRPTGRFAVKVPALIEKPQDMLQIPDRGERRRAS